MAKAAVELNAVDQLLPPEKIADAVLEEVNKLVAK
jgi:two-component system chemotaxis response regulator CheB